MTAYLGHVLGVGQRVGVKVASFSFVRHVYDVAIGYERP